jgi:hypothetical protein
VLRMIRSANNSAPTAPKSGRRCAGNETGHRSAAPGAVSEPS